MSLLKHVPLQCRYMYNDTWYLKQTKQTGNQRNSNLKKKTIRRILMPYSISPMPWYITWELRLKNNISFEKKIIKKGTK